MHGVTAALDAPLAPLTTIRTGGSADLLLTVDDAESLTGVLKLLRSHELSWYCLGAGSDLLVADDGYRGAVIRLGEAFQYANGLPDAWPESGVQAGSADEESLVEVTAGGACGLAEFSSLVAGAGLAGLEFACGIPGSIGGGIATNAGAYGRALADVLSEVRLATAEGAGWIDVDELGWEYRHCRLPAETVVTAGRFALTRDDPAIVQERHCSILDMRRSVQPQEVLTFGSTFKNPSGGAAGRLLDAAGLKGERRGGAEVSKVHANFVINLGDASTADVLALMDHMRQRVYENSGVLLEPEVRLLGADFPWESPTEGSRWIPSADG